MRAGRGRRRLIQWLQSETMSGSPFGALTSAWMRLGESALKSATAVNRAAMASPVTTPDTRSTTDTESADYEPSSLPSLAFDDGEWSFDRSVETADAIAVGDTVTFTKAITESDIKRFATVSGDTNRLHLDESFAADSRFGGRIAHGTLVSGLISAALARLPGLTIYLSQDLEFRGPVEIGDRITATVEVIENLGNGQYRLATDITDEDGGTIIDGEAVVLIDELPSE